MLDLLIVAYVQFVTKVKVEQSLYWPFADRKGFQEVEAPRFPDSFSQHGLVEVEEKECLKKQVAVTLWPENFT